MKKPILFILILFLFVSLMGVVSASQDSAMNNMTLTQTSDEMSGSLSGESAMDNLQISKDNEILATNHDLSGNTFQDIKNFFDRYIYLDEANNQIITTYDKKIATIGFEGNLLTINGANKRIYANEIGIFYSNLNLFVLNFKINLRFYRNLAQKIIK